MEKAKFIGITLILTMAAYLLMAAVFGIITSSAFTAANTVNASANAYTYRATSGALRFAPLALWFVPGGIGLCAIVWKLKFDNSSRGY